MEGCNKWLINISIWRCMASIIFYISAHIGLLLLIGELALKMNPLDAFHILLLAV